MAEMTGVDVIALALGILVLLLQSRKAEYSEVSKLRARVRELESSHDDLENDLRILLSSRLCRLILTLRGKGGKIASDFLTTGRKST